MSVDYKDLGNRVKQKREKMGMSQADLAEKADSSTQHVSNVENARTKIGLEKLVKIANALDSSVDELLCRSLKESRNIDYNEVAVIIDTFSDKQLKMLPDFLRQFSYMYKMMEKEMNDTDN